MPLSLAESRGALRLRGRTLTWGARTYVMGVVNVTPDSFSGDGVLDVHAAVARAAAQHEASSDLIDIGAESTRPGSVPLDARDEIARLIPVVRGVRAALPDAILSADTYKAGVFEAAHAAGADIANSVWGLSDELLASAARLGAPVVIMHNKARAHYEGRVIDEVLAFLQEAAERALRAGIPREHIVLDPGIGFGKTADQNLEVLRDLRELVRLGFPTLIGTSRKSTLGKLTGKPVEERVFATTATTALAVHAGIDIVRVHDVDAARDAVSVGDAIERGWRPDSWS